MRRLSLVICSLCAAATAAASATAAVSQAQGGADTADAAWNVVPDNELQELRGGMDLGPLVAYFAIQRTVQVDGIVVARMQIVISNLSALGNGGMPTISTSGPLAELVQIMNAPAGAAASPAAGASSSAVDALAPAVASNQSPASSTGSAPSTSPSRGGASVVSTGSNAGTVSGTGTQTGSSAQFGNAINTAVAAANGTPLSSSPSGATSSPAQGAAAAPSSAPTLASTGSAGAATPAQAANSNALTVSKTIPLGNTGQVVILSNLPNATALTTAVQNEVRAATIQTQTTITATLNSMSLLNAGALANAIRVQMPAGL
jgi:hypothetical protein